MNLIKYIYNKIKSSWDSYWIECEKDMFGLSPEERMQIMNNFKGEYIWQQL